MASSFPAAAPTLGSSKLQNTKPLAASQIALAVGLGLAFIAYCGTLAFDFAYDDRSQVLGNPWIRAWHYVPRYFTTNVWGFHNPNVLGNYYRPLFFVWLRVNYVLFGLRPWGWHLTSVLAHLGVTLLVYYLAASITEDRLTAAVAAAIFGVHPVHIEAVAWVSGVTDPSMALALIPSFLCYLRLRKRGPQAGVWLVASLTLYALALLAKETAIVLPLLVFAYEWIYRPPGGEAPRQGVAARFASPLRSSLPYLAFVPLYLLARTAALKGLGHTITPLPLTTIIFTWPSLLWFYLRLLMWPFGLSPCYDTPYASHPDFFNCFLPAVAVASVAFLVRVWARRMAAGQPPELSAARSRAIALAVAWLLVPILPLLNLSVFPRGDITHDRYLYLPSVGFVILAGLALRGVRWGQRTLLGQPAFQMGAALALVILLAVGTVRQSLMWADDLLLYSRGVSVAPGNRIVRMNLAIVACERGLYGTGIAIYKDLIAQHPDFWLPYYNLGYTYYKLGNLSEADRYLRQAAELNLLGSSTFLYLGLTRMKMGRLHEAEPLIRQALASAPDGSPVYHFALGIVLKAEGDLPGAQEEFRAELAVSPDEQAALEQLAEVESRLTHPEIKPSRPSSTPPEIPAP